MKLPMDRTSRSRIPAQSWERIESFYARLAAEAGWGHEMLDLVKHIRSTDLSHRLFAYTSHADLFVGIHPELDRHIEALRIFFDGSSMTYEIAYWAKPTVEPEVKRSYARADGIKKVEGSIEYLRW